MLIFNRLKKKHNTKLFTTPSHSQKRCLVPMFKNFYKYDVSETDTHNPEELLIEAEQFASKVYGTKKTKFLTNGSSSGVIAAVLALSSREDNVLLWRGAHCSHHNAVKLAGANPIYYDLPLNEYGVEIPELDIEEYLKSYNIKLLMITSPTYYGYVANIKRIKSICDKYGVKLFVDEAHGALYPFSDRLPETAVKYADVVVQSLHKTAGGLNPTALLHSNCDADIDKALSMITTTSPSYPLLMSIEKNIRYLNSSSGKKEIEALIDLAQTVNQVEGYSFGGDDPLKLLIKKDGLSGVELSDALYSLGVEDEKTNEISTMLLLGIGTDKTKIDKLIKVLNKIKS